MKFDNYTTDGRIKDSLIMTLQKTPLFMLKDKDLIETAQITGGTFYKYYNSRFEVLEKVEDSIFSDFKKALSADIKPWFSLKFAPSKKNIKDLIQNNFTHLIQFFQENQIRILTLSSKNGDPAFMQKLIEIASTWIMKLLVYYYHLYHQEKTLEKNKIWFGIIADRYAVDILCSLKYWIRLNNELTVKDAKEMIYTSITQSAYDITTHRLN